MSKLTYKHDRWEGMLQREDGEEIFIYMSDATFSKHRNAYLDSIGISTQTYSDILRYMEEMQKVQVKQYEALQHILELEHWLACDDPDVRIISTDWEKYRQRNCCTARPCQSENV